MGSGMSTSKSNKIRDEKEFNDNTNRALKKGLVVKRMVRVGSEKKGVMMEEIYPTLVAAHKSAGIPKGTIVVWNYDTNLEKWVSPIPELQEMNFHISNLLNEAIGGSLGIFMEEQNVESVLCIRDTDDSMEAFLTLIELGKAEKGNTIETKKQKVRKFGKSISKKFKKEKNKKKVTENKVEKEKSKEKVTENKVEKPSDDLSKLSVKEQLKKQR